MYLYCFPFLIVSKKVFGKSSFHLSYYSLSTCFYDLSFCSCNGGLEDNRLCWFGSEMFENLLFVLGKIVDISDIIGLVFYHHTVRCFIVVGTDNTGFGIVLGCCFGPLRYLLLIWYWHNELIVLFLELNKLLLSVIFNCQLFAKVHHLLVIFAVALPVTQSQWYSQLTPCN